ncbi:hypothetical protein HID58_001158, partial [Brassica napus]
KKVYCRSKQDVDSNGNKFFDVDYDYLVTQSNTFNIPGVEENCHFLSHFLILVVDQQVLSLLLSFMILSTGSSQTLSRGQEFSANHSSRGCRPYDLN